MAERYDNLGRLMEPVITDEGFLLVDAYITRPGVFEYVDADGKVRRELRPRDEVYAVESLASVARKPTTLQHPTNDQGEYVKVVATNARAYSTGLASESVWRDEAADMVRTTLTILDAEHIAAIQAGIHEQSCGYSCELEETAGEDEEFGPYDAIQRLIRYNHIATVMRGRAGRQVRLRADAAQMLTDEDDMSTKKTRTDMDAPDEPVADEQPKLDEAKLDAYMGKMDAMMAKMDEVLAMMPMPVEEEVELELDNADSEDARIAWFNQRQRLLKLAAKIDKADTLDNKRLAREIVKQRLGDKMRADASDEYVNAALDMLDIQPATARNTPSQIAQAVASTREDADYDPRAAFGARLKRST
jgi:uncharacterized protein